MTATQAICMSRHQNRIVHIEYSDDNEDTLLDECDDNVQNDKLTEYWGDGINGPWRVHMADE